MALSLQYARLNGRCVEMDGKVVGVLNPTTLTGRDAAGAAYLAGPRGVAPVNEDTGPHAELARLVATGSLLLADTAAAAARLAARLDDPLGSRTAAYFCCLCSSCEQINGVIERLNESRVLLAGCGGIGATAAMALAGAGIGSLVLLDPDRIELSNLNRQFFWRRADVGKYKVDVLAMEIAERFPEVAVRVFAERLTGAGLLSRYLSGCDAALFTADEPVGIDRLVRRALNDPARLIVYAGYTNRRHGIISWDHESRAAAGGADEIVWSHPDHKIAPSYGPLNLELAGQAAGVIVLALAGLLERGRPKKLVFDSSVFPGRFPPPATNGASG